MGVQAWHIWMAIGIICIIIEIFDPAFFFLSLGIAAIFTSLISLTISNSAIQILIFSILSFLCFISMRKLSKHFLPHIETNVFALIGKIGIVTTEIPADGRGYVKVGSEEWSAIEINGQAIKVGTKVVVLNIDGNKLIVQVQESKHN